MNTEQKVMLIFLLGELNILVGWPLTS